MRSVVLLPQPEGPEQAAVAAAGNKQINAVHGGCALGVALGQRSELDGGLGGGLRGHVDYQKHKLCQQHVAIARQNALPRA